MTPALPDAAEEGAPQLSREGDVARLRLSRPAQRNALRVSDLHRLLEIFAVVDADPSIRVLVLEADGGGRQRAVFSAGFDRQGFDAPDHDPRLFERVAEALEWLRPITVCALSGSVYGGATDLVLACDLRVALQHVEFLMPATRLGLHYYPGGLRRYVARLGPELARRAFLGGRALSVDELQAVGLFDAVVPVEGFDAAVAALAGRVAALAPLAAQATKQSLLEISRGEDSEARLRSREAHSLASADFAEGRAAAAAGRPPVFRGR